MAVPFAVRTGMLYFSLSVSMPTARASLSRNTTVVAPVSMIIEISLPLTLTSAVKWPPSRRCSLTSA
jgi:hypothetical protein